MSTSTNWRQGSFSADKLCHGVGLRLTGEVLETRVHSIFVADNTPAKNPEDNLPLRFIVATVKVKQPLDAERRLYRDGFEVNYEKNVAKKANYVPPQPVGSLDELCKLIGGNVECALPKALGLAARAAKVHPKNPGVFEFFIEDSKGKDLSSGAEVCLRTRGESPFVAEMEVLNGKLKLGRNADPGAQQIADSLSAGIAMATKSDKPLPCDAGEGVDSDEWSD